MASLTMGRESGVMTFNSNSVTPTLTVFKESESNGTGRLPCMSSFILRKRQRQHLKSMPTPEDGNLHDVSSQGRQDSSNDVNCIAVTSLNLNDSSISANELLEQGHGHLQYSPSRVRDVNPVTDGQISFPNGDFSIDESFDASTRNATRADITMNGEALGHFNISNQSAENNYHRTPDLRFSYCSTAMIAHGHHSPVDNGKSHAHQSSIDNNGTLIPAPHIHYDSSYPLTDSSTFSDASMSTSSYSIFNMDTDYNFTQDLAIVPEVTNSSTIPNLKILSMQNNGQINVGFGNQGVLPEIGLSPSRDNVAIYGDLSSFHSPALPAQFKATYEDAQDLFNSDYNSDFKWPCVSNQHASALDSNDIVEASDTAPSVCQTKSVMLESPDTSNDVTENTHFDDDISEDIVKVKGKRKDFSYIAIISKAILSSPDKRMLLSGIYAYLSANYKSMKNDKRAWRNSVRHNLSLNECFVKQERLGRGRGHYWSIHPACVDDFLKGDFRRRHARRRAKKSSLRNDNSSNLMASGFSYMDYPPGSGQLDEMDNFNEAPPNMQIPLSQNETLYWDIL